MEQSQTNLSHRSHESRMDVRQISRSTTLSDVDCGKFLVLKLAANTTLTLPLASSCIGCHFEGMVIQNAGGFSLTIAGDQGSNAQLVGSYERGTSSNVNGTAFGPHSNVPIGFGFRIVSTGTRWCTWVSGSRFQKNTSTGGGGGDLSGLPDIDPSLLDLFNNIPPILINPNPNPIIIPIIPNIPNLNPD